MPFWSTKTRTSPAWKPAEIDTCLAHVRELGQRGEAFEDILWALINSTEFMHRK